MCPERLACAANAHAANAPVIATVDDFIATVTVTVTVTVATVTAPA